MIGVVKNSQKLDRSLPFCLPGGGGDGWTWLDWLGLGWTRLAPTRQAGKDGVEPLNR